MFEEGEACYAVATARPLVEREVRLLRGGGLDKEQPVGREDLGEVLNQRVLQGRKPPVGRIDQHEIVAGASAGIGSQGSQRVLAENGRAFEPELVEVPVDRAAGLAIALDEGRLRGAAGERLEPHRAGAGEEIENLRLFDEAGADQVERGLADAVSGRPGLAST